MLAGRSGSHYQHLEVSGLVWYDAHPLCHGRATFTTSGNGVMHKYSKMGEGWLTLINGRKPVVRRCLNCLQRLFVQLQFNRLLYGKISSQPLGADNEADDNCALLLVA